MPTTDPTAQENEPLRAFVDAVLGTGWRAEDRSRTAGRKSLVWRIDVDDGRVCYLKRHELRILFDRTMRAHEAWIPALRGQAWLHLPEVLGVSDELGAVLLSEVPGPIVADGGLAPDDVERMYELAGRLVAAVNALPLGEWDGPSWFPTWRARLEKWLPLAEPHVDAETMAFAWAFAEPAPDEPEPSLVATHGDCSPRNWIFCTRSEVPALGVIDWERAQPSVWMEDVGRMAYDFWHDAPRLREAWFRGYGREPDALERTWLQRLSLAFAVGGIAWAHRQDDPAFVATNRAIIERVRAEIG